jgi:hypothetical protein
MNLVLDADALRDEIKGITQRFAERLPDLLQGATLDGFAKIRNRIQESGISNKGAKYAGYSENELPTLFFEDKATNAGGRKAIEDAEEAGTGLSYKDFKSANNGAESVAVRNLTLTGDMWRNIGITGTEQTGEGLVSTVAGETKFAQSKINWNAAQIGDFMAVSEQEETEIAENLQTEIDAFFEQNF